MPATKSLKETHIKNIDSVPGIEVAKILGTGKAEAEDTKGQEDRPNKGFPYW